MGDFLSFRKMITPVVIQVIFWLGVVACVIVAIGVLNNTNPVAEAYGVPPVVAAILVLTIGPLIIRIYCELLMVLFRIYESVRAIELGKIEGRSVPTV